MLRHSQDAAKVAASPRPGSPRSVDRRSGSPRLNAPEVAQTSSRPGITRPPKPPGERRGDTMLSARHADEASTRTTVRASRTLDRGAETLSRASDVGVVTTAGAMSRRESAEERVRVAVRIRPPVRADEKAAGEAARETNAMHCAGSTLWLLPSNSGDAPSGPGGEKERPLSARQFRFDWVLPPSTSQQRVFEATCGETGLVEGTLAGVNGCVMCYGQTGAGKTHTLSNLREGSEGIVPRALALLFSAIAAQSDARTAADGQPGTWAVQLAYVQIYMESVHDLLEPTNQVDLREAPGEGTSLVGNAWLPVSCCEDALSAVRAGERHRVTAQTSLNDTSSRSHSVLVLSVRGRRGASITHGRLFLVDLAGSERVKRSEASGLAFEEACAINGSLTCLGRCVTALAAQGKQGRAPFRESKLTRLLSAAFGGRSRTVLLVCVAPSSLDLAESSNALAFGAQAMNVKVNARANATVDHAALAAELRAQLDEVDAPFRRLEAAAVHRLQPLLRELRALQGRRDGLAAANTAARARARARAMAAAGRESALPIAAGQAGGDGTPLGRISASAGAAQPARCAAVGLSESRLRTPAPAEQLSTEAEVSRLEAELRALDSAIEAAESAHPQPALLALASAASADGAAVGSSAQAGASGLAAATALSASELHNLEAAVGAAWADVRRLREEKAEAAERFERAQQGAEGEARAVEAMESSLCDVASDLGRLALLYRSTGKAAEAVPLFVSAISIYEHTLGPTHAEVAKDLVNLGNALCDLRRHSEAEALYLRALEIDRAALGEDHPEVAMDLSNLGIVYKVQGRLDEAARLFEQALAIMHAAVGPEDPKVQTIARNLAATQVIDVGYGGGRGKAPEKLERRLSFSRRKAGRELQQHIESKLEQAGENREAALAAKVEKARLRGSSAANSARSSAVERASDAETVADDNDCGFGARLTGRRSDGDSS